MTKTSSNHVQCIDNSYYVLGLDSFAGRKEIQKRSKEITHKLRVEDAPKYDLDLGGFEVDRTEESIKEAAQNLSSPKKRIKEYFFWIQVVDDTDEKAINALIGEDYEKAIKLWSRDADESTAKSFLHKKNLAILYCLSLLKENDEDYLEKSLYIWKELIDSEKFWGSFIRVYELHDELDTTQEVMNEFRQHVTSHIADIYTELGHIHNDNTYISKSYEILKTKGEGVEKTITNPIYEEVFRAVEELESLGVSDDGIIDKEEIQTIKELIGRFQEKFNELLDLGLYDEEQSILIRDRAAEAIMVISLDVHNNLSEMEMALHLADIAKEISGTAGLKSHLDKERGTMKENIAYQKKNPLNQCWFCQNPIKNQNSSLVEKMHKVTDTEQTFSGTRTHFQMIELTIPRCVNCANFHKEIRNKHMKIGGGIGVVGGLIISILAGFGLWGFVFMSAVTISIGVAISRGIGIRKGTDNIESEIYREQFPYRKELISDDWRPGEKPSG